MVLVSYKMANLSVYPSHEISVVLFGFELFLHSPEVLLFSIFFFHLDMFDGVRFQYSQVFVSDFSQTVLIFSWCGRSIYSIIYHFPLFTISRAHFSTPNSIPISSLYILTACISVSNCFSFLANSFWCRPWILGGWFFLRFSKFVSGCAFPSSLLQIVLEDSFLYFHLS